MRAMLTCQELTELVTEYLERKMPTWDRLRFKMHVGMCRNCRNYIEQMQVTVDSLGQVPADPIPDDVKDDLMRSFRDWKRQG